MLDYIYPEEEQRFFTDRELAAARALVARPWFISRAGFTPEAEAFARREGIMISDQAAVERLDRATRQG